MSENIIKNPLCVISIDAYSEYKIHDIQTNSSWNENPYGESYAVVPDDMVQDILETQGFCDIKLNNDKTEHNHNDRYNYVQNLVADTLFDPGIFLFQIHSYPPQNREDSLLESFLTIQFTKTSNVQLMTELNRPTAAP